METTIKHFSHNHLFKQNTEEEEDVPHFRPCCCCGNMYSPSAFMYVCVEEMCRVDLCTACARLGEIIEHHVFHPQHPRIRLVDNSRVSGNAKTCAVCLRRLGDLKSFYYVCDDFKMHRCYFMMHIQCAHSVKPVLALPIHNHSLVIVTSHWRREFKCDSCGCGIARKSHFARCVPCNLNYHIYCERGKYEMPEMFIYPKRHHPHHRLSLQNTAFDNYLSCDVCGTKGGWPGTLMYDCLECDNFSAHLSCIFQSLPCPFSRTLISSDIGRLRVKDSSVHENALCQGCNKLALNGLPIYGCQYCNFFIHESCIQQPIVEGTIYGYPGYDSRRDDDPLVLVFSHGEEFTCDCCERECSGFMYKHKNDESFVLDLQCMLLVPSLELIGHQHLVVVMHEQNSTKTSYLRCTPCREKFNISRSRPVLLPNTLLHECHFHPLTLVPRLVDTDECYCDVCEDKRDPDEPIYYCGECKFEAHIACVESEVLGPSGNKLKDVEYVNSYEIAKTKEEKKEKIRIREILRLDKEVQYTNTLEKEFDVIFQQVAKITLESSIGRDKGPPNKILYSDDPFKMFIQGLNSTSTLKKARSSLKFLKNEEVVRVGEYLVPLNCEGLLETMSSKYRDFGKNCKCSQEAKLYLSVGLCKALQSMRDTKVVRVTEDLLVEWWIWFAMGNVAGFKIQFAIEIWKRAMYSHFGLEADKYSDGKLTRVRKEMKELPREIEKMKKNLENAKRELDETERKLEKAIAEEERLRIAAFRVKKSDLMNKCLKEAEDLVCNTLGEMLFPPLE